MLQVCIDYMAYKFNAVPNKFVPRAGQTYRFIGVPATKHGNISLLIGRRVWKNTTADNLRLKANNIFETFPEAAAVRTKIEAALKDAQKAAVPQSIVQNGRKYVLA